MQTLTFSPTVPPAFLSPVLRHAAKSGLSHKTPSREGGSTKCHLSWQASQVRCNCAGAVLSEPALCPIRHSDEEWIFRARLGKLLRSILPAAQHRSLILEPSPYFTFLPVLLVLDKTGFGPLSSWHCLFSSFGEKGKARMRD